VRTLRYATTCKLPFLTKACIHHICFLEMLLGATHFAYFERPDANFFNLFHTLPIKGGQSPLFMCRWRAKQEAGHLRSYLLFATYMELMCMSLLS